MLEITKTKKQVGSELCQAQNQVGLPAAAGLNYTLDFFSKLFWALLE